MNNDHHVFKRVLLLVILIIIASGAIAFFQNKSSFLVDSSGPKVPVASDYPVVATTTVFAPPPSANTAYKNSTYAFSFEYPKTLALASASTLANGTWSYGAGPSQTGTLLARVEIPKTLQPKTNFSEAQFNVGVSSSKASVATCTTTPVGNGVKVSHVVISGVPFVHATYSDAGAGNIYEVNSYHAVYSGKCYAIEQLIHSSNLGNYSPDQGIKAFDKTAVQGLLDTVLWTFSFVTSKK